MAKNRKKKHLNKTKRTDKRQVQHQAPVQTEAASTRKEQKGSEEMRGKNLMKYKYRYLAVSGLFIVPGLISLLLFGLKTSIDFTGGSALNFSHPENPWKKDEVSAKLTELGLEQYSLTDADDGKTLNIRTKPIDVQKNEEIKTALTGLNEGSSQASFETVGPSIGAETVKRSLTALAVASAGIVFYIAYAFRNVPKPLSGMRFGISAIIAMLHDIVIVTGIFSFLGRFKGVEVDPMFITAILTTLGFSVHDTIVVFDRMRENLGRFKGRDVEWIANYSVLETMRRSLVNSATIVITLTALFVFGGATIKWFVFALLVGVISGTYSSMFNAVPVLVIWESFLKKKDLRA